MRVVIAGGHGKIALRLERLLADRGDLPAGLIRNRDHAADLLAIGAQPNLCDLEGADAGQVAGHLTGADAVVFAAGAGPGSGTARKDTVDRAAAGLLADAAEMAGVRRYLLISAMGLDRAGQPGMDEVFAAYLWAKQAAEEDVRRRQDLDATILRPGRLTDQPGTGLVLLAHSAPGGAVTRDDVAAVVLALLGEPASVGLTLELVGGDVPISRAVRAVLAR